MTYEEASADRTHDWQCPVCRLAARAREGFLVLPNNPLVVAALQAICAGGAHASTIDGGWRRNRSGEPVYEFWNGAGGRIVVRVDATTPERAWADVRAFSSLSLDVAVALLSGLASDPFRQTTCAPRREPVTLGVAAVLNAKGYRRYGAEREAFAMVIAEEWARLERLRFDVIAYPGFDPQARKWKADGVTRTGIALFERADMAPATPANDLGDCAFARPLRLGAWTDHWLNSSGVMWTTATAQTILRLDHRENRSADALAKRIALILWLSFGAARASATIRMPVRQLLRRIGLLRRLDSAQSAHNGRLADRVEEALLRLSERGLLKSAHRADVALALRDANRRWFEEWLDTEVVFQRPSV